MTNRERTMAVLNYKDYDRLPIVHFGFWNETLEKWHSEGHISEDEATYYGDNNEYEAEITGKLGFDYGWQPALSLNSSLSPPFRRETIKDLGNGRKHVRNSDGVTVLSHDRISSSICAEVDHLLKDRDSWNEHYKPRLQFSERRTNRRLLLGYPECAEDMGIDFPHGLNLGSLFGYIRNWMGVEGISFLYYEDEELYDEIIDTLGDLVYNTAKEALETMKGIGFTFDYAHFWEDICFKNGPLVVPKVFEKKVGPHYRRITDLLNSHGVNIVSLDCDGVIDTLVPVWLNNGVNTMFPIEVGTWGASIEPWRGKYGKELRGVGGMNKNLFAADKAAIDSEVKRLQPLVALGGYIPCPDHRIPPGAKWELVQYYTDSMRKTFGG